MPKGTSKNQRNNKKPISSDDQSLRKLILENVSVIKNNEFNLTSNEETTDPLKQNLKENSIKSLADNEFIGDKPLKKPDPKKQSKVSPSDHRSELDLLLEDVRESIKEKSLMDSSSQMLPDSAYQRKKKLPKLFLKIDEWISTNLKDRNSFYGDRKNKSRRGVFFFSLVIISVLLYIFYSSTPFFQSTPTNVSTNTPVPTFVVPEPFSLELPGGWTILLDVSKTVFPDWKPTQAEWLKGTEICKLIGIPWNIQIDAVYKTIITGDILKLTMDNKDQYPYQIDSIKMVSTGKVIELVNSNEPCMVIFLYKEGATNWQILTAKPSKSK